MRTWLFRIALNLSINVGRARSARALQARDVDAAAVGGGSEDPESESRLLEDERASLVRRAVRSLPPRQRQVVILRMYEELQFNEIASVLECPIGTAKANFFHAMNNLRKALA